MTTSTDGIICYGVQLDEDQELPWDDERYDGDIDSWWLEGVLQYSHSFPLYNERGNWIDGIQPSQERIDRYYDNRRKFRDCHESLPIELVRHCSRDFPMCIVAVKGTVQTASRGRPLSIFPPSMVVSNDERYIVAGFCKAYGLEIYDDEIGMGWWLASYWG